MCITMYCIAATCLQDKSELWVILRLLVSNLDVAALLNSESAKEGIQYWIHSLPNVLQQKAVTVRNRPLNWIEITIPNTVLGNKKILNYNIHKSTLLLAFAKPEVYYMVHVHTCWIQIQIFVYGHVCAFTFAHVYSPLLPQPNNFQIFPLSCLDPLDSLKLGINHEWPAFRIGQDCGIFDGHSIGWQIFVVPAGNRGTIREQCKAV